MYLLVLKDCVLKANDIAADKILFTFDQYVDNYEKVRSRLDNLEVQIFGSYQKNITGPTGLQTVKERLNQCTQLVYTFCRKAFAWLYVVTVIKLESNNGEGGDLRAE